MSHDSIIRLWRWFRIQPWRCETFKFSTDPELKAKVRDVVGLYLNPPQNSIALSVDEKSQIQALGRTALMLPMRPCIPERQTYGYVRHDTTTLFAALEIATGKVTDACYPRHRITLRLKTPPLRDPSDAWSLAVYSRAVLNIGDVRRWSRL